MREKFIELRNNRMVACAHTAIYLLYMLVALVSYVGNTGMTLVVMLSVQCMSAVLMFFDIWAHRGKFIFLEHGKAGVVYHALRLALACTSFFVLITPYEKITAAVIIGLFSVELILYVPFDETINRVVTYLVMVVLYTITFGIFYIRESNNYTYQRHHVTFPASLATQIFTAGLILLIMVIVISEILAAMWNCFEKKVFSQDRAVENLNELNRSLEKHQEEIKKINEVLGRQKIDLQAANKKINRAHDEMSLQSEVASTITSSIDMEEMLENVTRIMRIRLDMDLVMVILEPDDSILAPGEESKGRYVAISDSMGEEFEEAVRKSVKETNLHELLSMSQTYIQNTSVDTIKFFRYLDSRKELPSMICLPVMKQVERLGTLIVGKNRDNAFAEGRSFYENVASQLSIGISNARLYARMNDMAIRDALTRIYNRGHLQKLLNEYLAEAMAKKIPVTLALFDIDKFKLINDNYGHQCGDEVIRFVSHMLNHGALKNHGIAGRYGGEEFVIAFLGKSVEETHKIVKQIHDEIREKSVTYADQEIHVTASAGIASYPETCSDPGELLTRADWAMYTSKKNGRDQITIDSDRIIAMM